MTKVISTAQELKAAMAAHKAAHKALDNRNTWTVQPITVNGTELLMKAEALSSTIRFRTLEGGIVVRKQVEALIGDQPMRFKMSHGPDGDIRMSRQA